MPRIKSAKKRMRQTKTRTARNKAQRSQFRNAVKKVRTAAAGPEAMQSLATAEQLLDRSARKRLQIEHAPDLKYVSLLWYYLREKGVHVWEGRPLYFTTAHTDVDFDHIVRAFTEAVAEMQAAGFLPASRAGSLPAPLSFPRRDSAPTTEAQREIFHAVQMGDEANCAFNESNVIRFDGALDTKSCFGDFRPQHRGAWQHAAREDVLLDEIDATLIGLPTPVRHGDDLKGRGLARFQAVTDRSEIDRPVSLPNCLEHLDAGDPVIEPLLVAVVLQLEGHEIR